MKILITGGTGFLGSHLARNLADHGADIIVLARHSSSLARLSGYEQLIHVLRADNVATLYELLSAHNPDCIIHTACNYGRGGENIAGIVQTNLVSALTLLTAAADNGIGSFINTDTTLDRFLNAYTLSKKQFSEWGVWFARHYRIRFVNVLLEHMYGPGDDASKFTTHVISQCIKQTPTLDLTPGDQRRDFIYIEDTVAAFRVLVENLTQLAQHEEIQVGSGHAVTIREFAEMVRNLAASSTTLNFGAIPYRDNEPMLCVADITRLRSLGWKPLYDLASGIRKTITAEKHT
ncbi:MAG: NAD-dependent epimerase/dehydratase family protein [Gammaproteobacteria bacterium]